MTFENTSVATPSDGNAAIAASLDNAGALARLQADAGLSNSPAKQPLIDGTTVEDVDKILKKFPTTTDPVHDFTRDIVDGDNNKTVSRNFGDRSVHYEPHVHTEADTPPTACDRTDAEKSLENRLSKLIPEADRKAMCDLTTAITNGDSAAFALALKNVAGDPRKLKILIDEVDKMMEEKHCSIRLDLTGDGKVLVSDTGRGTALAFDPATGKIDARAVEQNADGSILVKPGELIHVDKENAFKEIGDRAVNTINGKPRTYVTYDPIYDPEPIYIPPIRPQFDPPINPAWYTDPDKIIKGLKDIHAANDESAIEKPEAK